MAGHDTDDLMRDHRNARIMAVICPTCGVDRERWCVRYDGRPSRDLHAGRYWSARDSGLLDDYDRNDEDAP